MWCNGLQCLYIHIYCEISSEGPCYKVFKGSTATSTVLGSSAYCAVGDSGRIAGLTLSPKGNPHLRYRRGALHLSLCKLERLGLHKLVTVADPTSWPVFLYLVEHGTVPVTSWPAISWRLPLVVPRGSCSFKIHAYIHLWLLPVIHFCK